MSRTIPHSSPEKILVTQTTPMQSKTPFPIMRMNACTFEKDTIEENSILITERARLITNATTPPHIRQIIRQGSDLTLGEIMNYSDDVYGVQKGSNIHELD